MSGDANTNSATNTASVTACIPYYRGRAYIRRAVESLLAQTHRNLRIVIANDGDPHAPWEELAGLDDPRLVFFDLARNHGGPFFAYAVVAAAADSTWFLVQEQDDWSDSRRVEQLLRLAISRGAGAAVSAQEFHRHTANGHMESIGLRWRHTGRGVCPRCTASPRCQECFVDTALTQRYWYRAPHTGLLRLDLLRGIGGYYAGLRLHFDALLMNLVMMTGSLAHTPAPLYHRLLRADSITHSPTTGFGTPPSDAERAMVRELYGLCFADYSRYLCREIDSEVLSKQILRRCQNLVTDAERDELQREAERLRQRLARCN